MANEETKEVEELQLPESIDETVPGDNPTVENDTKADDLISFQEYISFLNERSRNRDISIMKVYKTLGGKMPQQSVKNWEVTRKEFMKREVS